MNRPTVLILSADPSFARELTAKWPQGSANSLAPEFVLLDPTLAGDLNTAHYDLAIADACNDAPGSAQKQMAKILAAAGKPSIIVHCDQGLGFCSVKAIITFLHREPSVWAEITALLGREIVRRRHAESRSHEAENQAQAAQADATLGRYMLEMRVNVNNALTTLLGNAELLSHESGLPANVQSQADAICNMALRLHGIFQRFSLLEKELSAGVRTAGPKALAAIPTVH